MSYDDDDTDMERGMAAVAERVCELQAERDKLRSALLTAMDALALAQTCHGATLLSDPPQDAWKARSVSDKIRAALVAGRAATGVEPCPRGADKPEPTCTNRHQCWEPCGELGHSAEYARPADPEAAKRINDALGVASGFGPKLKCPFCSEEWHEAIARVPVDPCPGCERGGTCNTAECGRKQSSELMRLYGTSGVQGGGNG
jgi:hypothetical protein